MSTSLSAENPFCTRRVRPGAINFIFSEGDDLPQTVERLRCSEWWGEIVGPHGSGKSTLLATLIPAIEEAGQNVVFIELHDGQRRLPVDLQADSRLCPPAIIVVDGYEQLGLYPRLSLKSFCRQRGLGLLVTTHRSVGMPPIAQTTATAELASRVVHCLFNGKKPPFTNDELALAFSRNNGDLRETLFTLYDLYEQRR